MSAEDFIFRVEHLQQHYAMTWLELLRDLNRLLAITPRSGTGS